MRKKSTIKVLLLLAVVTMLGCAGVEKEIEGLDIKISPTTLKILLGESGYALAFYTLSDQSEEVLSRTEGAIETALEMLKADGDVIEMITLIKEYVSEMPQFKEQYESYFQYVGSALRLLDRLAEVNLDIPEKYDQALKALKAFLVGAGEGIEDVRSYHTEREAT